MNTHARIFSDCGFRYYGVFLDAYRNEAGELKKRVLTPIGYHNLEHSTLKSVYDSNYGCMREPNAIGILTEPSNISTIDIDKPEECAILGKLLKDCKFYVKTRKGYHFYFKKNDLARRQICGVADINTQTLFFCPEYKEFNINSKKEYEYTDKNGKQRKGVRFEGYNVVQDSSFKYELVKSEALIDMPEYAYDWCQQLILMKPEANKNKVPRSNIEKVVIDPNIRIEKFNLNAYKAICKILHEKDYFGDYKLWLKAIYMLKHINNTEEGFKIFDKFSRKVAKYKSVPEYENRRYYFGNGSYDLNFDENGILILCSKLNKRLYKQTLQHLYVSKYEPQFNYIDTKFIYPNDGSHDYIYDEWMKNGKVLMLKSQYGSGKTYAFKKLLDKHQYKRVLFITYRQSLANSLCTELKEKFGFDNYLENGENGLDIRKSERLILQLDSLGKICGTQNLFSTFKVPHFDLLVLDETEGTLNHMSYEKIDQQVIYTYLEGLVSKAPKVLCLDGDLADRSYDFISGITTDYKIYINKNMPNKKHFKLTTDIEKFDTLLDEKLAEGKKIVIVSMTRTDTETYYSRYKDQYNVIIHNGLEKNKLILKDVNTNWAKGDLLIYSPSVESGVDFTVMNHFEMPFCVLSNRTNSYRAFFQMLNRVRHYVNNEVICYLSGIKFKKDDILYRFDELKLTKYKNIELTNLLTILIHNDVEKINNKNHFYTAFMKTLKDKGHTFEVLEKPKMVRRERSDNIIDNIVNSKDLKDIEFYDLLTKQRKNKDLTRGENLAIEKTVYKKKWLLDELNEENLKLHYRKNYILTNYKLLNIQKEERGEVGKFEYLKQIKFNKIDKVKSVLEQLGFAMENDKITGAPITAETLKQVVEKNMNDKEFKIIFGNDRELKTKNHLSTLNTFLSSYGLHMDKKKHSKKQDKKVITTYDYHLEICPIIIAYLERHQKKQQTLQDSLLESTTEL